MSVHHFEILVEEPSMEALLRLLLPRVLTGLTFEVYPYSCKDELLALLPQRLSGYARRRTNDSWFRNHCRIAVLMDCDQDDCERLKGQLETMAADAGLLTRSGAIGRPYVVANRIAIEELEAWYFGDWEAVRRAYPKVPPTIPSKAKFRDPDAIRGGTWEVFERVLQQAGYFKTGLRKIEAACAIASQMVPERNTSRSFQVFHEVVREMAAA